MFNYIAVICRNITSITMTIIVILLYVAEVFDTFILL